MVWLIITLLFLLVFVFWRVLLVPVLALGLIGLIYVFPVLALPAFLVVSGYFVIRKFIG